MKIKNNILFIVNPISGKGNAVKIMKNLNSGPINYNFLITKKETGPEDIRQEIRNSGADTVVAVGGDGTVNMVATALKNSEIPLGIIPCGSGNGLARSLGYSMNPIKSFEQVLKRNIRMMDAGTVNGKPFYCTAGIGFDAAVAHDFAHLKKRGLINYVRLVVRKLFRYKFFLSSIPEWDNSSSEYFMITIGNAPQFGNDFYIVPRAKLNDGMLDICAIKKFNVYIVPSLLSKIIRKKVFEHSSCLYHKLAEFTIKCKEEQPLHTDGEPAGNFKEFHFRLEKQCLKVIVPKSTFFD